MADESNYRTGEVGELDLDGDNQDLERTMREAVAAVEEVESAARDELAAPPAPVTPAVRESEAERLRRESDELRDRLMRTLADFDNLRKRTERERQELRRYALFETMRELVAVTDNLERAAAAGGSVEDVRAGVELILRQMRELLRRHGVTEVEALGRPFDPSVHEAVSREEDPRVTAPIVVDELQRGYRMHDRLLRPAMVRVAVPAEAKPGQDEGPAL
jgi:molecular chaperone GrpE